MEGGGFDGSVFAHSVRDADQSRWELLSRHLTEVGDETAHRASKFGCADMGRALGLLHDFGKYKPAFQRYIRGVCAGGDKSHSTSGAILAKEQLGWAGLSLAHAVAGHHAGLQDGLFDREGRLATAAEDLRLALSGHARANDGLMLPTGSLAPERPFHGDAKGQLSGFQSAFRTRMLFSCLIDADRYCTERFTRSAEGTWEESPAPATIATLADALKERLAADRMKRAEAPDQNTEVNRLRQLVFEHVTKQAQRERGVFTLTVPTGGGKTLTGLSFALEHARAHALDRVMVVIPFTSVIEQTAQVYRDKLGDLAGEVLEHHSAFEESDASRKANRDTESQDGDLAKRRLVMETWSPRIVVTTAVQFFESLFSNRPAQCRKLHNLANSVIVLDEAQTLPLKLLRPCVAALKELQKNYGATIVLCTATQPALEEKADTPECSFVGGFIRPVELAPNPDQLFTKLRRVTIRQEKAPLDDSELAELMANSPRVLCIVNTRNHARELFTAIRHLEGARHLSTTLYPAHRSRVLAAIKHDLREGRPCRLVSTTLVEAGIDFSFPRVLRAEAGLDSIAQAAGRCNREGIELASRSEVLVFKAKNHNPIASLQDNVSAGASAFRRYAEDPLSRIAMESYFRRLYWHKGELALDKHGVLESCEERSDTLNFPFATIAKNMKLIDDPMAPVIVHIEKEADEAVKELRMCRFPGAVARKLQRFTVGVPEQARNAMIACRAAEIIRPGAFGDQFVALINLELYQGTPGTAADPTDAHAASVGLDWNDPTYREPAKNLT